MATSTRTTIRNGSTGSDVETLQMMLNEVYGSVLVVDGIFGNKTEGLVKQYQENNHLVVDGIVGSETWDRLEGRLMTSSTRTTVRNGSTGSDVRALQSMLNEIYGSVLVIDSIFGNKTEGLVKQYQQETSLVVDGIVGPATWTSLEDRFSKD